jgi:2-oxo-4-hydroxy-4-carboxy-5-ureidoimidazoline decarboxylase
LNGIAALDRLDRHDFVAALGGIFEHSPWVAESVADARPFADVASLHRAMVAAVAAADEAHKLALLRAHPELAGKLARDGDLSKDSAAEQAGMGLDRLAEAEASRFAAANEAYRARFGFPFIIAVKGQRDRSAILAALDRRLGHSPDEEIATALAEVAKIARFRLDAMFPEVV